LKVKLIATRPMRRGRPKCPICYDYVR